MRAFVVAELTQMRDTQASNMQDTCLILSYQETFDAYHQPIAGYATGSATACSFNPEASAEARNPNMTIVSHDATLRLPLTSTITDKDRVRITHRFTEAITNQDFGVVGQPHVRPTCLSILLERVE